MTATTVFGAIDHGTKRIGIAVSDPGGTIASPLTALDGQGPLDRVIERILKSVEAFEVDHWVIGLPLNMDGTEGEQAKLVRRFGERLGSVAGCPVDFWDERLSSESANEHLAQTGLTHKQKKSRRDAIAAQVILQSFLDARDP